MNNAIALLAGAGVGAAAMFVLDPQMGGRRRALARDKVILAQRKTREAASVTARDLKNRTAGLVAEGRSRISVGEISDEVLEGRVRSKLGFLVRHPSAIEVQVANGCVTLSGPVLADEVGQLVNGVRSVRGVSDVDNRLEVHNEPANVPGLQGDKPKPTGQPLDIMQRHWSPSSRFLLGTAGAALLSYSFTRYSMSAATMPFLFALGPHRRAAEDAPSGTRTVMRSRLAGWSRSIHSPVADNHHL